MEFVPGIELNIKWQKGEFHLLGLGLRSFSDELKSTIAFLSKDRRERNEEILRKMKSETGFEISISQLEEKFATKQIGRPHFARFLVEKGIVKKPQEAFDRFLGVGRPWYAPHSGEDLDKAICAIKKSGGLPVLAHPKSLYISLNKIEPVIASFRERGVEGVEAYHPCVREAEAVRLEKIARNLGMFVTAGSDFHGKGVRADRHLGFSAGGEKIANRFWFQELLPALGKWDWKESDWLKMQKE